ncbi:hypothetical protein PtA15_2A177 [Puccinia triticina]|uniref:Uncharacterized protein n=1 Tax=Puccinia triticina TaxID=208348 RepID=A0ABY7CB03_9BASI|nr:uncharacterized protein PtA15_2A177 [Puccinia triticina]WAQ81864.1 hypothetical protein PtA15_2A177 [Puccinia triticina]
MRTEPEVNHRAARVQNLSAGKFSGSNRCPPSAAPNARSHPPAFVPTATALALLLPSGLDQNPEIAWN